MLLSFFIWECLLFLYKQDFMGLFHKQLSLSLNDKKNLRLIGCFYVWGTEFVGIL